MRKRGFMAFAVALAVSGLLSVAFLSSVVEVVDATLTPQAISSGFDGITETITYTTYVSNVMFNTHPDLLNASPYVPYNPEPANGAVNQPARVALAWSGGDPDGDLVTYDVYISRDDPVPNTQIAYDITSTRLAYVGDYEDCIFYWRVVATDITGESTYGPVWYFIIGDVGNLPPLTPYSPLPAHNTEISGVYIYLYWQGGDPDGDAVTYDVYYEVDDSTPDVLVADDVSNNEIYVGSNPNTSFYWQVVATDVHGLSTPGPIWHFTAPPNTPPTTPHTPIPADQEVTSPVAGCFWIGGDPDEGDLVYYDVYMEVGDSTPDNLVVSHSGATMAPVDYCASCTIYWQVIATDLRGARTEGPVWVFYTTGANSLPDLPENPQASVCDNQVELSWTGSDPDGDTITFDVYMEANNSLPDDQICEDVPENGRCAYVGLQYNTPYYWKVNVIDEHGALREGPVWQFETGPDPAAELDNVRANYW